MNHIPAKTYGYASNKDVKFSKYKGIYIKRFRSLNDCELELGSNITVISGKNGTMKSSNIRVNCASLQFTKWS